jgi:hypothetical protein
MARIIKVVPHNDHTITIELSNNHRIIYDMRPRLNTELSPYNCVK